MKLWRKLAKKENGVRNGRSIKHTMLMQELMMKNAVRTTPLLEALFKRAGMSYSLSKKQQEALKNMIEKSKEEETSNAAV